MVLVRQMRQGDNDRVSEVLCSCYRWLGEREGLNPKQVEWLVENRGSLEVVRTESRSQTYLVACTHDGIVGMVAVKDSEITKLYVDPDHHRQGIGWMLFEAAEKHIRDAGFKEVELGAWPSAVLFYKSMGMSVVGKKDCGRSIFSGREFLLMKKCLETL